MRVSFAKLRTVTLSVISLTVLSSVCTKSSIGVKNTAQATSNEHRVMPLPTAAKSDHALAPREAPALLVAPWKGFFIGKGVNACSEDTQGGIDHSRWCAFISRGLDRFSIELW